MHAYRTSRVHAHARHVHCRHTRRPHEGPPQPLHSSAYVAGAWLGRSYPSSPTHSRTACATLDAIAVTDVYIQTGITAIRADRRGRCEPDNQVSETISPGVTAGSGAQRITS